MNIKFISFGGPSKNYHRAVNRITNEAKMTKLFTEVKGFTDLDLKNDKEFWPIHGKFLENNKRGYGYWIWKPYLIKKTLDSMNENDILFYADAGCKFELNKENNFLIERINHIKKEKKIIGTFTCPEISWTKMDLIKYLEMEDKLSGRQHSAGAIMFIKTHEITKFVNEWWRIATLDNYHYVDDTPSKIKNTHHFKEHRHDQSIFSLLTKKYNLYSELSARGPIGSFFHTARYRNGPSFDEINYIPSSKEQLKGTYKKKDTIIDKFVWLVNC